MASHPLHEQSTPRLVFVVSSMVVGLLFAREKGKDEIVEEAQDGMKVRQH
jgi:hypothetical protein